MVFDSDRHEFESTTRYEVVSSSYITLLVLVEVPSIAYWWLWHFRFNNRWFVNRFIYPLVAVNRLEIISYFGLQQFKLFLLVVIVNACERNRRAGVIMVD